MRVITRCNPKNLTCTGSLDWRYNVTFDGQEVELTIHDEDVVAIGEEYFCMMGILVSKFSSKYMK